MILSASGVVTEFSNLYLGNLNDGKCSNLPHLKMCIFQRGFNFATLLKTLFKVCQCAVTCHCTLQINYCIVYILCQCMN